eukprot:scaffold2667_cov72-Phaeocystis_antarctica.AAC.4
MHTVDVHTHHVRQRARTQPLRQPLHAVNVPCQPLERAPIDEAPLCEFQLLERWQHRGQRAQLDLRGLAQLLAAPQPHLAAQRCGHLVISPQLLPQRLRQLPQLTTRAAEVHGQARFEHVAQLAEDVLTDIVRQVLKQRDAGAQLRRRWLQRRLVQQCGERVHRRVAQLDEDAAVQAWTAPDRGARALAGGGG